jgi:hypothetical protein
MTKNKVSPDQRRFQLYPINYGAMNHPDSTRGRRWQRKGGSPPSRPCPPNVDPETGEIKGESLSSRVLAEVLGERLPPSLVEYRKQRPVIWGAGHLKRAGFPVARKEGSKIARIVVGSILAVVIIYGTVSYATTPHGRYDYPGGDQQRIEDANRANKWQQEHPFEGGERW